MTQHEAEATSLLVILPTALAASLALRRRHVGDLPMAPAVGTVGAVGAVTGVLLALALDADVLRLVFAALLAFVGSVSCATPARFDERHRLGRLREYGRAPRA